MASPWCAVPVDYELQVSAATDLEVARSSPPSTHVAVHARPNEPVRLSVGLTSHTSVVPNGSIRLVGLGPSVAATIVQALDPDDSGTQWLLADFRLPGKLSPGINPAVIEWVVGSSPDETRYAAFPLAILVDDAKTARIKLEPGPRSGLLGVKAKVVLENTGSEAITLHLAASHPDTALRVLFSPREIDLCAGESCYAIATLRRRARWFGESRRHVFDISANGSSGTQTTTGIFRQLTVFPPLLFKLLAVVLMIPLLLLCLRKAVHLVVKDNTPLAWTGMADGEDAITARTGHSATWVQFTRPDRPAGLPSAAARAADWLTGRSRDQTGVIMWGGVDAAGRPKADGAFFSVIDNVWSPVTPLPDDQARVGHQAVWTGERLVTWGGLAPDQSVAGSHDGAQFDPMSGQWEAIPDSHLEPRIGYSMIWTGRELIVFGGMTADGRVLGDGGILRAGRVRNDGTTTAAGYGDLSNGVWSLFRAGDLSPSGDEAFSGAARAFHAAGWDGRYMLVSGGMAPNGTLLADSYTYNVAINRWDLVRNPLAEPSACHQAVATLSGVVLLGGIGVTDVGARVVPVGQRLQLPDGRPLTTLCTARRAIERHDPRAWMVTLTPDDTNPQLPTFTWVPLGDAPEHLGNDFRAAWMGTAIGVVVADPALDSVAVLSYVPGKGTDLQPLPSQSQLGFRSELTAAWSRNRVLVWGGRGETECGLATAAQAPECLRTDGARLDVPV